VESGTGWRRAEVGADGRATVDAGGTRVAVFVVDGTPYAVANACPHAGNPLVQGDVLGSTLVCAFHGWRFDLATGACLLGDEPVRTYPAELREGAVWVDTGEL
jgi:nitrite reductase/ring-hydroxylating ferredoxin subunit